MGFPGFDRNAMQFFHELAVEMNREWFTANKQRYEQLWQEPLAALFDELQTKLAKTYTVKLAAPKIFRIYRDTRFSKDKTPYKTNVAGMLQTTKGQGVLYMHVGIDEEFIGVGHYFFDDKQLAKWRKLIVADKTGKQIETIVKKLRKAGYPTGGHDDYKKVPKGLPADHPRAEFLKMRGLTSGFPEMPRGLLHSPELVDWLVKHAKATAPMVNWLYANVK